MKSKLPIKMGLLKLSLMPHLVPFYQEEIKFNLPPVANNSIFFTDPLESKPPLTSYCFYRGNA